jgi:hypothetical protein
MMDRLFIKALLALAEAGKAEQACRLAAQGYSTLRRCDAREAERLNQSRAPSLGCFTCRNRSHDMTERTILDVRSLVPAERHQNIFKSYDGLAVGDRFVLVNDHGPKPLWYQFDAEHHGEFSWRYLGRRCGWG